MAEPPNPTFAEFLQSFPLYKPVLIEAATHESNDVIYWPLTLWRFCEDKKCGREMEWETYAYGTTVPKGIRETVSYGNKSRSYTCRHCERGSVEFFLFFGSPSGGSVRVEKIGQRPRPSPILSRELANGLGEQGRELYIKAVDSRNLDMGMGALAYLRRVVENAMNALLDHISSAVEGTSDESAFREALDKARQEKNFTNKVGFAKAALPPRFFHADHNPLERLHEWSSVGLHSLDDWECLEVFDEIRALFELLFERLARDHAERKLYEDKLVQLTRKKERSGA